MKLRNLLALAVVVLPVTVFAEGDTPWMPIPGTLGIGITYTDQSADVFYRTSEFTVNGVTQYVGNGDQVTLNNDQDYRSKTGYLKLSYGIIENLSADVLLGYSSSYARTAPGYAYINKYTQPVPTVPSSGSAGDHSSGRMDTMLGVKWRIVDEFNSDFLPTITMRINAIIKGDYDAQTLAAVGKGGDGFEIAALFGKQFGADFSLAYELGIQVRDKVLKKGRRNTTVKPPIALPDEEIQIPPAAFTEITGDWMFADEWSTYLGVSHKRYFGSDAYDIGGYEYRRDAPGFPSVAERRTLLKTGLNWAFASDQGVAVHFSTVAFGNVANRSTVKDKWIVSLSYDINFSIF